MKKLRVLALALILTVSMSSVPVFAKRGSFDDLSVEQVAELENALATAMYNYEDCDVSDFDIEYNAHNQRKIYDIVKFIPESFHVDSSIRFDGVGDKLTAVKFEFNLEKNDYYKMLGDLKAEIADMAKDLDHPDLDSVEKALVLHDRLAQRCTYTVENSGFKGSAWTSYGAIMGKKAVCEGYAKAYKMLLAEVGIESTITASEALNHAWNIVYIDGKAYHVDVTYDDPISIVPVITHRYFMCSTDKFFKNEHKANDFDRSPTDKTYDELDFNGYIGAVSHHDGKIYYFEEKAAKCYDGGSVTEVLKLDTLWYDTNIGMHAGVAPSMDMYNGGIYYNDEYSLYRYDVDTAQTEKVYTTNEKYLIKFYINGDTAYCHEGDNYYSSSVYEHKLSELAPAPEPKPEPKPEPEESVVSDTSKIFTDISKKGWYKKAVDYCYDNGFIKGVSSTEFGRNSQVTRGMFITILARMAGVDTTGNANKINSRFDDVKSGKYYAAAIKWANDNGIVSGISETQFGPERSISRQDLCVMVVNFSIFMDIELTAQEDGISFADGTDIAKYAKGSVSTCQKAGIVNGYNDGTFGPKNTASRAEAAQILYVFHSTYALR